MDYEMPSLEREIYILKQQQKKFAVLIYSYLF